MYDYEGTRLLEGFSSHMDMLIPKGVSVLQMPFQPISYLPTDSNWGPPAAKMRLMRERKMGKLDMLDIPHILHILTCLAANHWLLPFAITAIEYFMCVHQRLLAIIRRDLASLGDSLGSPPYLPELALTTSTNPSNDQARYSGGCLSSRHYAHAKPMVPN